MRPEDFGRARRLSTLSADIEDLLPLWPTGSSCVVSYLFIAIIWVNHHHLMQFAKHATQCLVWINFGHLFAVSLAPFTTAWVAQSRLTAEPVALYAAIFIWVNLAFRLFENAVLAQAAPMSCASAPERWHAAVRRAHC
jgi:uncharacterized membrane protein